LPHVAAPKKNVMAEAIERSCGGLSAKVHAMVMRSAIRPPSC
jgi:hypothetical protein